MIGFKSAMMMMKQVKKVFVMTSGTERGLEGMGKYSGRPAIKVHFGVSLFYDGTFDTQQRPRPTLVFYLAAVVANEPFEHLALAHFD